MSKAASRRDMRVYSSRHGGIFSTYTKGYPDRLPPAKGFPTIVSANLNEPGKLESSANWREGKRQAKLGKRAFATDSQQTWGGERLVNTREDFDD